MVGLLSVSPPGDRAFQTQQVWFVLPVTSTDLCWPSDLLQPECEVVEVIPTSGQWWRTTSCRHTQEISLRILTPVCCCFIDFVSTNTQWKGLETMTQFIELIDTNSFFFILRKKCKTGKKKLGKTRGGGEWASKTSERQKKVKENAAQPRLDFRKGRVDETMMSATRQQNKPSVSDTSVKTARKTRKRRKEVWMLSDRATGD